MRGSSNVKEGKSLSIEEILKIDSRKMKLQNRESEREREEQRRERQRQLDEERRERQLANLHEQRCNFR